MNDATCVGDIASTVVSPLPSSLSRAVDSAAISPAPQLIPCIQGTGAVQKLSDFEVIPKENSSLAPCWPGFSLGAWKAPVQAERAKSMLEQV